MAQEIGCESCPNKAKYDNNPKSFGGRIWRWHINFCPGWKMYMKSMEPEKRTEVATKYNLKKWL